MLIMAFPGPKRWFRLESPQHDVSASSSLYPFQRNPNMRDVSTGMDRCLPAPGSARKKDPLSDGREGPFLQGHPALPSASSHLQSVCRTKPGALKVSITKGDATFPTPKENETKSKALGDVHSCRPTRNKNS